MRSSSNLQIPYGDHGGHGGLGGRGGYGGCGGCGGYGGYGSHSGQDRTGQDRRKLIIKHAFPGNL